MNYPDEIKEEIVEDIKMEPEPTRIAGGKRKSKRRVNPALGKWVAFVKKVQKEEKLSYRDAMMRAKVRKDKGEKWMKGGEMGDDIDMDMEEDMKMEDMKMEGGRRRRRRMTHKKRGSRKRRHTRRYRGGQGGLNRVINNR